MDIQTLSTAITLCSKKSGASDLGIAELQKRNCGNKLSNI